RAPPVAIAPARAPDPQPSGHLTMASRHELPPGRRHDSWRRPHLLRRLAATTPTEGRPTVTVVSPMAHFRFRSLTIGVVLSGQRRATVARGSPRTAGSWRWGRDDRGPTTADGRTCPWPELDL